MKQILLKLKQRVSKQLSILAVITFIFSFSSCDTIKLVGIKRETQKKYPVEVYLKNNKVLKGYTSVPQKNNKVKLYQKQNKKFIEQSSFSPNEINYLAFYHPKDLKQEPTKIYSVPTSKKGNEYWLPLFCNGPKLNVYLQADYYTLTKNGFTLTSFGSDLSGPASRSIYFQKKGDYAHFVGTNGGGIINENSSLRHNIKKYLSDDSKLCQYITDAKLGSKDICNIAEDYKSGKSKYSEKITKSDDEINNYDYAQEKMGIPIFIGTDIGFDKYSPSSVYLGLRGATLASRYFYLQLHVGAGIMTFIDKDKAPIYIIDAPDPKSINDISKKEVLFMFGGALGFRYPISAKSSTIIPSFYYDVKHYGGNEAGTFNGPAFSIDYLIPLKSDNRISFSAGVKYNYSDLGGDSFNFRNYSTKTEYSVKPKDTFLSGLFSFAYVF